MAGGNAEVVRQIYAIWNGEANIETAAELIAEDAVYVNPDSAIEPGTRDGRLEFLEAFGEVNAAFEEFRHDPIEIIELGDTVLALLTFSAKGRDSGVELSVAEQQLWTFEDGKVVRFEWFHDEAAARRAAGL
jgi:ketosteroid isomerase-like protein